ncbi:MAG: leucine-rich repeat protein, partial [Prevotella sp.]|nr:leucine-rich repeat protein [Prevotella sp.]
KCSDSYRATKYGDVGWANAFGRISEDATPSQVMEISTFGELETFRANVNGGNDYGDYIVRLTADLIKDGGDNINQWRTWEPIGTVDCPFRGIFDGQGHTIKNVRSYRENGTNVGLFGYINNAIIKNLVLQNFSLEGKTNVGVVAGRADNSLISDILVYNATENSCAKAATTAGGIVGQADNTTVSCCYIYGKVTGQEAGGIVGRTVNRVNVSDCASACDIQGNTGDDPPSVGGIVADAGTSTTVERCYSRSTLSATQTDGGSRGGIIGKHGDDAESAVRNCAYVSIAESLPLVAGTTSNIVCENNRRCETADKMKATQLSDLLGDMKWHYFDEARLNDYPIPATLADDYLLFSGLKSTDGFTYMSMVVDDEQCYSVIGYEGSQTDLTLPETYNGKTVVSVGARAFKGSNITSVVIPDSYTTIGTEAFADCSELSSLTIGDYVTSAYDGWLNGCNNLQTINTGSNIIYQSVDNALYYRRSLDNKTLICCTRAFKGTLTLPADVDQIVAGAFQCCDDLTVVDLRATTTDWGTVERQRPDSPFYQASPYTLFVMNAASYASNTYTRDPNVVNQKTTDSSGGYSCRTLKIADRLGINSPVAFDLHFSTDHPAVDYDRTFEPAINYTLADHDDAFLPRAYTVSVPFKINLKAGQGATLYRFYKAVTKDDVTTVQFIEVEKNKSNYYGTHSYMPYYLVVDGSEALQIGTVVDNIVKAGTSGSQYETGGYAFKSTMGAIDNEHLYDASKPKYILQSDGNWHKVPQNEPKAFVGAFRAYFTAPSTADQSRSLLTRLGGDEQTGIRQIVVQTIDHDGSQHYYDLNGRRLSTRPQHGIYIHNGKTHYAK